MFINYSLPDAELRGGTISPSRFEVALKVGKTLCFCIAATIIGMIGALVAMNSAYTTPSFWLALNVCALSLSSTLCSLVKHHLEKSEHQCVFFHRAVHLDEYKAMLDKDRDLYFTFRIPNCVQNHLEENRRLKANLRTSSYLDTNRQNVYQLEGKDLSPHLIEESYGEEIYILANQSIISEICFVLMSRYQNNPLHVYVQQRSFPDTPNTKYNLTKEKKTQFLTITQLFQISHVAGDMTTLGYIKASLRINLTSGDAVISWRGPQDAIPEV